jgi:two-component system, cell cycle response regulator
MIVGVGGGIMGGPVMGVRVDDDDWDTGITNIVPPEPSKCDRAYLIILAGDGLGEMHQLIGDEVVIGRAGRASVLLRDDGVSRVHAIVRRQGDTLTIEDMGSRNGTFLNGNRITTPTVVRDGDKIHIGHRTVLRLTFHDALDDAFQKQLREAAMYDALTHIYSRRYFVDRLEAELQFAIRHDSPLALVLLDLDHLKDVNDTYGHGAGDRVLAELAAAIQMHVRGEDLFGRIGGDEFGVLCRGTPLSVAASFAERVRQLVNGLYIDVGADKLLQTSVSVGVTAFPDLRCVTPAELVAGADRALYVAKARGRDRVAVQPDEGEDTRTFDTTRPVLRQPSRSPDGTSDD